MNLVPTPASVIVVFSWEPTVTLAKVNYEHRGILEKYFC